MVHTESESVRRGHGTKIGCVALFSQTEFGNDALVTRTVGLCEVLEEARAASDHLQQTTTSRMILLVAPQVLGKLLDSGG